MRLDPIRFKHTEHVNQDWTLTVEGGTTLEDVLEPDFLANVSTQLRPYDRVRVRTDTGEWYAELLILSAGRTWAKAKVLLKTELTSKDVDMTQADGMEKYDIQHRGPHLKFCVIRKADKQPIKEEFETKKEAQSWLAEFIKT